MEISIQFWRVLDCWKQNKIVNIVLVRSEFVHGWKQWIGNNKNWVQILTCFPRKFEIHDKKMPRRNKEGRWWTHLHISNHNFVIQKSVLIWIIYKYSIFLCYFPYSHYYTFIQSPFSSNINLIRIENLDWQLFDYWQIPRIERLFCQ